MSNIYSVFIEMYPFVRLENIFLYSLFESDGRKGQYV